MTTIFGYVEHLMKTDCPKCGAVAGWHGSITLNSETNEVVGCNSCHKTQGKKTKGEKMLAKFTAENHLDANGKPAGGMVSGVGLEIMWQNGPLGRGAERIEPNGAFVETVIAAALQRIQHYQETQFKCRENAIAITKLEEALLWLNKRTQDREARQVEGTHAK